MRLIRNRPAHPLNVTDQPQRPIAPKRCAQPRRDPLRPAAAQQHDPALGGRHEGLGEKSAATGRVVACARGATLSPGRAFERNAMTSVVSRWTITLAP